MSDMAQPVLSIVIPAFNEASRLPGNVPTLVDYCTQLGDSYEVLIVVEKSTDGTFEKTTQAMRGLKGFQVIDNQVHRGKGYAVRSGMRRAQGAFLFYMDADLSTSLEAIRRFLRYFEEHPEVDVLIGSRQHPESRFPVPQGALRQKMGQTFNMFVQRLAFRGFADTQCGFKAFRRAVVHEIFARQTLDGFAFDVEVLMLAQGLGYRIAELPVEWTNEARSKVHVVRDSLRMLRDVWRVRRRVHHAVGEAILKRA
jgi:dolichyl-phosphate beta-glucosyltransferase